MHCIVWAGSTGEICDTAAMLRGTRNKFDVMRHFITAPIFKNKI